MKSESTMDNAATWPEFWQETQGALRHRGYQTATLRFYRQVLRSFARHCPRPADASRDQVRAYLGHLGRGRCSWHWTAMNISVLRNVFDHLHGHDWLEQETCPRRSFHLPETLSHQEIEALLSAGRTFRNRLLMGLLYRCGLKPGEAVKLQWRDVDPAGQRITVRNPEPDRKRTLPLPEDLLGILRLGADTCAPEEYVFPGTRPGRHLSTRMLELIVHRAASEAGINRRITAMILRHTFAVHALRAGHHLREVQVWLGHRDIRTTERYLRCTPPHQAVSPLDQLPRPASASPNQGSTRQSPLTTYNSQSPATGSPITTHDLRDHLSPPASAGLQPEQAEPAGCSAVLRTAAPTLHNSLFTIHKDFPFSPPTLRESLASLIHSIRTHLADRIRFTHPRAGP